MKAGKNLETGRRKTAIIFSVFATAIIITAALTLLVLHENTEPSLKYTEQTLFLGNNTLLNGNYPVRNTSYSPDFVYFDPLNKELYIDTQSHGLLVMNTSTNKIVGNVQLPNRWFGAITFDSNDNISYIQYGIMASAHGILEINQQNQVIANFSTVHNYLGLSFDPHNGEFYAYMQNNTTSTNNELVALNQSFQVVNYIYTANFGIGIEYNPINKLIYSLNSGSNFVTIIGLNNTIIRNADVGSFSQGMAIDPISGSVSIATVFGVAMMNKSLNYHLYTSNKVLKEGGPSSAVAYDSAYGVALVGLNGANMAVVGPNSIIGYIPVGQSPWGASYDQFNHAVYVANPLSSTITIINITAVHSNNVSLVLFPLIPLVAFIASTIAYNRHRRK